MSIANRAHVSIPENKFFDMLDIITFVKSKKETINRIFYWCARTRGRTWRAVREGLLKYISRKVRHETWEYLFDLESDPAENQNLLNDRSNLVKRLKMLFAQWERKVRVNY